MARLRDALHRRIAADIRRRILAGDWPPGEQLPSRADLAREYEVHPQTIRLALVVLRAEGFVDGRARRRLEVAYPPAVRTLTDPDAPWPHGSEVVESVGCAATRDLAGRLGVPVGARLRREVVECWEPTGRSAMVVTSWWRGHRRPHRRVVVEVAAVALDLDAAHALRLAVDTVAYRLVRTRLDASGAPVETADLILPMDRWEMRFRLERPAER